VRANPLTTRAPNDRGKIVPVTLTPRRILDTLLYTDVTPGYVRATPAALVSFTEGNELPLARMVAEANGASTSASTKTPIRRSLADLRAFSEGAYLAYACTDYPQLWNVKSDRQGRHAQYERAVNGLDPYSVAPWTTQEWSQSEFFVYNYCIGWPKPRVAEPPFPAGGSYPDTPTLVLNGDLDLRTDIYQAQQVAANFPNSTYLEVPNYGHVTALYDPDRCTSVIARRFVRTLEAGDTSCLASISEHRVVQTFPKRAEEAPQATVRRDSDESRADDRRAAYVAVESVADVIDRWYAIPGYRGTSLYGGRFVMWTTYSDPFVSRIWKLRLDKIRWTKDIAVSGKGQMQRGAGKARMELELSGNGTDDGQLVVTWSTRDAGAMATIRGAIGGRTINLKAPAPSYF
jgi:pimeloyl-ACP methyl ester carboxylesterase